MEKATRRLTLSAMFLALGLVLPFLTGQVPQIGNMLLPMHLPVFLCGLLCGWQYGAAVGFALPLLRSSLFALPVMFPAATAMAFELMTYGLVAGLLYSRSRWQCLRALYRCLLAAMVAGRLVWGVVQSLMALHQRNKILCLDTPGSFRCRPLYFCSPNMDDDRNI